MDCQTFDSSLLDAIYDEIDASTSTAMDEHAAGCTSCAANIARLRKTRSLVHPALEVPFPDGLEGRILAAATAAMDAPKSNVERSNVVSLSERRGIVAFLSKPQFAIAAAFVLVLGATAIFTRSSDKAAPASVSASEPAYASDNQPRAAPAPAPVPTLAAPVIAASATATTIAMAEPPSPPAALARKGLVGPAADEKAKTEGLDPAFTGAKALFDAGHYAEALPKFQALATNNPEAELYVARCLVHTNGCAAADPHFDSAGRRSGPEEASHTRLEAARCYKNAGEATAARSRYNTLTDDPYVAKEANAELADISTKAAVHARPPAAAPAATAKPPAAKKVDVAR